MKVKEIMKPNPITLTLQDSLKDLINVFRENEIGSVIIVDQKKEPYQIVTLRDLSRLCFLNLFTDSIFEALKELNKDRNSLITVSPNDPYLEALSLMEKFNISHLPVVNQKKKLVGILSIRDIAKNFPELIFIDPLTEVNNRAYLNIIKTKIKKISGPATVLMVDIDNFKDINDTFGHVVGDKVLKRLSQTLRKNVKITDEVIRYGGEEFLVIAYRCNLEEGKILAERLRRKIENIRFNKKEPKFKITVSIGLSIYEPQEDFLTAIEKADKAMYKAKQKGKNRVEVFEENSLSS
uniref:diguanylate cyclase n=1 Tax=Thermodesulfobacterium geofontis TaxID=1295609 RepID=A0A7V5XIA0_9BACT